MSPQIPIFQDDLLKFHISAISFSNYSSAPGTYLHSCSESFYLSLTSARTNPGGGPYLPNLAPSYLTSMRANVARTLPYVNLQAWHASHSQPNLQLWGWVFDQMIPPRNWYGIWPGSSTPNTIPWEPVRIMCLPRIPSRYRASCDHTVLVAFVPMQLPLRTPTVGLSSPNLQRIKMYICGPR